MQSQQEPKPIVCKAAICYEAKKPLVVEEITVDPPKEGEIRMKVIANALCHTDVVTLDGLDSEGKYPVILGHQATGIVESIGKGVTRVKVGDIVIPCYTPQCLQKSCIYCSHKKCNLCPKIRGTQGNGFMPDQTTRFKNKEGKQIFHFMGCSTFSEYTVIAEISAAKINPNADMNKVCMIGCGVSTGWGAVMNNTDMKPGKTVAVWGLGAVGLSVIQAAKIRGAKRIYAIDINPKKFDAAKKFGADVCYQPTAEKGAKAFLIENEKWGINYTYDCTGNVNIMREALQTSHRGFGESCVIGVASAGKQIATRSFQLVTGRKWLGTAFGGWKSIEDVPKLVNKATLGEWPIEEYVTHQINGLEKVNQSIEALHSGECLRAIIKISQPPKVQKKMNIKVTQSFNVEGGKISEVTHWSQVTNCFMNFNIYIPDSQVSEQRGKPYPVLYCLGGLTCTHDNFPIKSGFAPHAKRNKLALVFPDTSPRNTNIPGVGDDWTFGNSASYYVDATSQKYAKHFQMFTYLTQELPKVISTYFPVSETNMSITGFSMGGHGALIAGLKTNKYRSVSAFAPISHPMKSEWGAPGYKQFFKNWETEGNEWDATELVKNKKANKVPLFIDHASHDKFIPKLGIQSLTEQLINNDYEHIEEFRGGYQHSFYYVSTFIGEHIDFHAKYLNWYA